MRLRHLAPLTPTARRWTLRSLEFDRILPALLLAAAVAPTTQAQLINGDFEFEQLTAIRDLYSDVEGLDICENNTEFGYGCVPDTADDGSIDRGLALQLGSNETNADAPFYYYGNTSPASLADPIGTYLGRVDQSFFVQSIDPMGTPLGIGPFLPMVPSGWTLKRVETPSSSSGLNVVTSGADDRPVFLSTGLVSGVHQGPSANPTGALIASGGFDEDVFVQLNTDSDVAPGRFFTPSGNDPGTLQSQPEWLASGNNAIIIRNRNNRLLDGAAGDDAGRGTVLANYTGLSVEVGEEVTLEWLVGDRIGALQLVDYDVVVRADGTTIYSENSATDTSLRPFNDNGKIGAGAGQAGTFREIIRTFTATSAGELEVSFGAGGAFASNGGLVGLDNVRLSVDSGQLLGDADGDGDVDGDDLIAVQTNFGSVTPPPGDADGDGDVDGDDLIAVQTNFGATASLSRTSSVPESSALGLLTMATVLLGARPSRRVRS